MQEWSRLTARGLGTLPMHHVRTVLLSFALKSKIWMFNVFVCVESFHYPYSLHVMHMSKHFTDNIVKTELIVESKLNNMVYENMSYYDHVHTTDLYNLSFTDKRIVYSGC